MSRNLDVRLGVDQLLTTLAQGYANQEYVGKELVKVTPVKRETDYFPVYGKEYFKKIQDSLYVRAVGSKAYELELELPSTKQYICTRRALQGVVDEAEIEASHPLIKLLEEGVEQVQDIHELNKEIRIAEALQNEDHYDGNAEIPVTKWDNTTAIDEKLEVYKEAIADSIGRQPNVMLVGSEAYNKCMMNNTKLSEKLGANERRTLFEAQLADLLGLEKVFIGRDLYFDDDGQSQKIWGNNIILAYVNPNNGKKQPTFARLFQQSGYPRVKRWFDQPHFWRYEIEDVYDIQITGPSAGYLIKDVTAV